MIFIVVYILLIGLTSEFVDNNGHIGGVITGIALGFYILEPKNELN